MKTYVRLLAFGHMTMTVCHMIHLLMWLIDYRLQIYSTKRRGTSGNKHGPEMEAIGREMQIF